MNPTPMTDEERDALTGALRRMQLLGANEAVAMTPLAGGVSSLIVRADLPGGPVCIKRALAKLRVARDWTAPVTRSDAEYAYLQLAGRIVPQAVPRLLGHDPQAHAFAMAYLPPDRYPVWKSELLAARIDAGVAAEVGRRLARIHAATAGDAGIAAQFANDASFFSLRLDPYLGECARVHPDLAPVLRALIDRTASTRRVLVHGDVSPKNILLGPDGPVLLDAECANYGDPAFDLAFCLNHLLLKGARSPADAGSLASAFEAFATAYLAGVTWEPAQALETRTAALLPGLLLARVDGKSPVEYLTDEPVRDLVRRFASARLQAPPRRLMELLDHWNTSLR